MQRLILALALVVPALPLVPTAPAADKEAVVVVPLDEKPFKVSEANLVRLTGKGIAGSKIDAKVDGPAKVSATHAVSERKNGSTPIGTNIKEFVIKPSGKGKVKVTITMTPPQPDAKPKVTEYEFEVE